MRAMMSRAAIALLSLIVAVFSLQCHATLPADNGGTSTYAVGDIAPKIAVVCSNFSNAAGSDNYTLVPTKGASLIVLSVSLGNSSDRTGPDLFVQNMVNNNASLDAFLGSDAVGSDAAGNAFLFVVDAQTDDEAATTRRVAPQLGHIRGIFKVCCIGPGPQNYPLKATRRTITIPLQPQERD